MHKPRISARLTAICVAAALLSVAAAPVMGAASRAPTFERPNCVVFIDPVAAGETTSEVHGARCFKSFSEAMAYATGGRVKLPANASRESYSIDAINAIVAGESLIGRDYEDPDYSCNIFGPCLDWWVQNDFGCNGGRNYVAPTMPTVNGFNWNDQISSTKAFTGCSSNKNYEHTNYGGAVLTCTPNCSGMGAMNDKTSSKQWRDL
jgi:hypothetical protein